jgi:hypothetical protein
MNVGDDNAFNILVGDNGGREPLGSVKVMGCELTCFGTKWSPLTGSCEHRNKLWVLCTGGNFLSS